MGVQNAEAYRRAREKKDKQRQTDAILSTAGDFNFAATAGNNYGFNQQQPNVTADPLLADSPEVAQEYITRRQLELFNKYGVPLDKYLTGQVLDPQKRNAARNDLLAAADRATAEARRRANSSLARAARDRGVDTGSREFAALARTANNNIELQRAKTQTDLARGFNDSIRQRIGV